MKRDPVVEETRKLRQQYAAKFGHNTNAIFDDIINRQNQSGTNLVTLPHRKQIKKPTAV